MNTDGGIHRGDIVWVDIGRDGAGRMEGRRPALVVQNDVGNRAGGSVIVASITTRVSSREYPCNLTLPRELFDREAEVRLGQLHTLGRERIGDKVTRLSEAQMERVDDALLVSLGLPRHG